MNVITPDNVPHTTDRFVVIPEGDLQRLRQYTSDVITLLHKTADECKSSAVRFKANESKNRHLCIIK